jgi:uncharacterized protein (DUF2141 family)
VSIQRLPAAQRPLVVTFRGVVPGSYALIAVHEEDGDGEMTKSPSGFPREGFGTSNNPSFLGPSRFRPALFAHQGLARLTLRMVYP